MKYEVHLELLKQKVQDDDFLNNKALGFIDLDDEIGVNYGKFEGLVEGI